MRTRQNGVVVRRGRRGDVPAVAKLLEELLPGETSLRKRENILVRALRDPRYDVLVAVSGETNVGMVDLWTFPDAGEGGELSTIQNMVVTRRYRGMRIADLLVERVVELAQRRRAMEIHVSTEFQNRRAIALYEKHGFTNRSLWLEKGPL